jgi:AraC-like DNA-binding protein
MTGRNSVSIHFTPQRAAPTQYIFLPKTSFLGHGEKLMSTVLSTPMVETTTNPFEARVPVNPEQEARLKRVMEYLKEHFREHPTLDVLARVGGLSPFHFHRLFRACYGKTLKRVNTELQIEHAKQLMLQGVPAADAAQSAGFANQSHLTSRFKLIYGLPPGAWLRRQRARAVNPSTPPDPS